MSKAIKIGSVIEDTSSGQFSKVINVRNGIYGLGGWTSRKSAEKQSVATIHMNGRALRNNASLKITSAASGKVAPAKPDAEPKEPKAPEAPKSTIAKPAVRKAAKRAQAAQKPARKTARKSK